MKQYKTPPCAHCAGGERGRHSAACAVPQIQKAWRARHPRRVVYLGAKHRARRLGRDFAISQADVDLLFEQAGPLCGGCGHEMVAPGPHAPSLDRVDNGRGYVPGNVAVLCKSCNAAKGDRPASELRRLADFVERQEALAGSVGRR